MVTRALPPELTAAEWRELGLDLGLLIFWEADVTGELLGDSG